MGIDAIETAQTTGWRPLGGLYWSARARFVELVEDLGDAHSVPVPACSAWSVHDMLSHLTGSCADVLDGNIDGVGSEAWTRAQVEGRRRRTTADVLAEWDELAPRYVAMIDDFPGGYGRMAVADITSHEHDLRGALARPGERNGAAVTLATDFLVTTFLHLGATAFGLGPLEVKTDVTSWVVGGREPEADGIEEWKTFVLSLGQTRRSGGDPVASVRAETFELFRAISGRRSPAQIRGFEWSTDPDAFLSAFAFGPFAMRDGDLEE